MVDSAAWRVYVRTSFDTNILLAVDEQQQEASLASVYCKMQSGTKLVMLSQPALVWSARVLSPRSQPSRCQLSCSGQLSCLVAAQLESNHEEYYPSFGPVEAKTLALLGDPQGQPGECYGMARGIRTKGDNEWQLALERV